MQPPWKLVVEDLGRIARAEIEARPLLLFVGGNNTGKTYLASMLWGLLSLSGELPVHRGEAFQRCVAWIEERYARRKEEPEFKITPEVLADFVQILNDTLREQRAVLAARTFNRKSFKIGKLELHGIAPLTNIPLCWETFSINGKPSAMLSSRGYPFWWSRLAEDAEQRVAAIQHLTMNHMLGNLSGYRMFVPAPNPAGGPVGPVFLPASRTGFMLLYRSFAQKLVGDVLIKTGGQSSPVPDLTAPTVDFLQRLIGLRNEPGSCPDEAIFLEQEMGGSLSLVSGVGVNEVLYQHAEGEPPLPMELSSSLVTELAPLILTLRHVSGYIVLIIEEPEAHLHPRLQRRLAQVIVRLIRKGLFVWITTHSENFCQQINNFMKLGAHPRRAEMQAKYGYEEMDYLEMDDVAGYQFEPDVSGRSIVTEMKKTPSGLVMPTFNRELADLTDQALDLELPEGEA